MHTLVLGVALATLVALGANTLSAAPLRLAADAALAGLTGGLGIYPEESIVLDHVGPTLGVQALRLGIGAETRDGYGLTVGAALAQLGPLELSVLPITVRAFRDFDPTRRWRRRTAYAFATYHWKYVYGVSPEDYDGRFMELGCGVAWTFAVVTPEAELRVRPRPTNGPNASL
jgi:hypothetical protein